MSSYDAAFSNLRPGDKYMGETVIQITVDQIVEFGSAIPLSTSSVTTEHKGVTSEWIDGIRVSSRAEHTPHFPPSQHAYPTQMNVEAAPPTPQERLIEQVGKCIACDGPAEMLLCALCKEAMSEVRKEWVEGFIEDMEEGLT
jgi:hypothetical protein